MTSLPPLTTAGVFCGISTQWISGHKWFADLAAVLFDEKGPHPSLKGTPHTVLCHTDFGPIWGSWGIYCLSAGSVSTNFADTSTQPSPAYPTWTHPPHIPHINPLRMTRLQVYRLVVGPPPPTPVTIANVQAIMTKMGAESKAAMDAANEKMESALLAIDNTVARLEQSFDRQMGDARKQAATVALEHAADVVALSVQVAALSKEYDGDARNANLQAAIVRMATDLAEVKDALVSLKAVPKGPTAFWARLLVSSFVDPAVPSTATAFMVTPTMINVDGLKDAVKLKVPEELSGVSVLRLKVWAHDAACNQWVPVDEDCALVANDTATAYHVVVQQA